MFVTQHGRDQLHTNWPDLYKTRPGSDTAGGRVVAVEAKGRLWLARVLLRRVCAKVGFGAGIRWRRRKRLAYARTRLPPAAAFPAHWAPNGMVHYDKKEFPARYRNGVFIAFHGSWNRAPYAQGGYNVVFQPLAGRPRLRAVRNICRWFCGGSEIAR